LPIRVFRKTLNQMISPLMVWLFLGSRIKNTPDKTIENASKEPTFWHSLRNKKTHRPMYLFIIGLGVTYYVYNKQQKDDDDDEDDENTFFSHFENSKEEPLSIEERSSQIKYWEKKLARVEHDVKKAEVYLSKASDRIKTVRKSLSELRTSRGGVVNEYDKTKSSCHEKKEKRKSSSKKNKNDDDKSQELDVISSKNSRKVELAPKVNDK